MPTRRWVIAVIALLTGLGLPLLAPAPAGAASPLDVVLVDMGLLPPGLVGATQVNAVGLVDHDNHLVITVSPDRRRVEFRDPGAVFVGVPPCIGGLGVATCLKLDPGVFALVGAVGGLGNDRIEVKGPSSVNDYLVGGDGNDTLVGGPGISTIDGDGGADTIRGGGGDDTIRGGPQGDDLSGGPGYDSTVYFLPGDGFTVSQDELANDGLAGERDNVRNDVESVETSVVFATGNAPSVDPPGGDTLIGNDGDNSLGSHNASASISGLGGNDSLGVTGVSAGISTLDGGDGDDRIVTNVQSDIDGGDGADEIYADNGYVDQVDCGPGLDEADVDDDDVVVGCETLT